jgi:hypothetical protein
VIKNRNTSDTEAGRTKLLLLQPISPSPYPPWHRIKETDEYSFQQLRFNSYNSNSIFHLLIYFQVTMKCPPEVATDGTEVRWTSTPIDLQPPDTRSPRLETDAVTPNSKLIICFPFILANWATLFSPQKTSLVALVGKFQTGILYQTSLQADEDRSTFDALWVGRTRFTWKEPPPLYRTDGNPLKAKLQTIQFQTISYLFITTHNSVVGAQYPTTELNFTSPWLYNG